MNNASTVSSFTATEVLPWMLSPFPLLPRCPSYISLTPLPWYYCSYCGNTVIPILMHLCTVYPYFITWCRLCSHC